MKTKTFLWIGLIWSAILIILSGIVIYLSFLIDHIPGVNAGGFFLIHCTMIFLFYSNLFIKHKQKKK